MRARRRRSAGAATWLSELIWRDFYFQVLANFPHVADEHGNGHSFRPRYDAIALGAGRARRCAVRGLVRGPHRLPAGGRGDGADQPDRLHAQPAAHGHGQLPVQGPGHRLAPRRALLRAAAQRLRAGVQQRRLAVGQFLAAATRSRTFASSTRSARAERFDPEGKFIRRYLPAAGEACRRRRCTRPGPQRRWSWRPPASSWGRTTPPRWSTTPRHASDTLRRYAVVQETSGARRRSSAAGPACPTARASGQRRPRRCSSARTRLQQLLFRVGLAQVVVHAQFAWHARGASRRCAR